MGLTDRREEKADRGKRSGVGGPLRSGMCLAFGTVLLAREARGCFEVDVRQATRSIEVAHFLGAGLKGIKKKKKPSTIRDKT